MNEHALRAFSYNGALNADMEPSSYTWQLVPVGNWAACLDFKTWSNTSPLRGILFATLRHRMMANVIASLLFGRKMVPVVIHLKMV